MKILIVDDSRETREVLADIVRFRGHDPVTCESGDMALELCLRGAFPVVVTDIRMPGKTDGMELLRRLKTDERTKQADVILLTGHGDMDTAVEALRRGAYDFLSKPINAQELAAVVERAAEHQSLLTENRTLTENFEEEVRAATQVFHRDLMELRSRVRQAVGIGRIVAVSGSMREVIRQTRQYHDNPTVPVLIEGETGTGKEIIARLIHFGENGSDAPLIDLNCSAIPRDLFESELFGYEKGAFTGGAQDGAEGKLEAAGEGTLLLDEVGEIPLGLQPKLLRVLQERSYYRVGGTRKRQFAARIVCATNRNLEEMVEAGTFRRDLFHRLAVGHIRVPPLRERIEEILPLAQFFLEREAKRKRKGFVRIAPEAGEILKQYAWPGNVRELENAVERAVLVGDGEMLQVSHLDFLRARLAAAQAVAATNGGVTTPSAMGTGCLGNAAVLAAGDFELPENGLDIEALYTTIVEKALGKFDGNKSKAAEYLGISRFAIKRRLEKLPGEKEDA